MVDRSVSSGVCIVEEHVLETVVFGGELEEGGRSIPSLTFVDTSQKRWSPSDTWLIFRES